MMDFQQLAFGLLLAKREKDKLKELGADVPSNFNTKQGILFGAFQNSLLPTVLLQNESKKLIPEASKDAQTKLSAKDAELEVKEAELQLAVEAIAAKGRELDAIAAVLGNLSFKLLRFIEEVDDRAIFTKNQLLALIPEDFRDQDLEIPSDIILSEDQKPIPFVSDLDNLSEINEAVKQVFFTNNIFSISHLRLNTVEDITSLLMDSGIAAGDMPTQAVITDWVTSSST